ncbi:MAG: DUF2934 domain-containing protein [Limisphaerales bacterium]
MKTTKRKQNPQREGETAIKTLKPPPTEEEIRQRAHQNYLARDGAPGRELDDWLLAERQIYRERIEEFKQQNK